MTARFERCGILLVAFALLTQPCKGQQASGVGTRIERLSAAGSSGAARAVADSVLATTPEGSDDFVEALYWHAVLDSTAAGAERGYLRIVVEYPLAARASAALWRLAELELARQARDRARRHLDKLRADYPKSDHIARAQYFLARMARDDGETERACALLNAARKSVDVNDVNSRTRSLICMRPVCQLHSLRPLLPSTRLQSETQLLGQRRARQQRQREDSSPSRSPHSIRSERQRPWRGSFSDADYRRELST